MTSLPFYGFNYSYSEAPIIKIDQKASLLPAPELTMQGHSREKILLDASLVNLNDLILGGRIAYAASKGSCVKGKPLKVPRSNIRNFSVKRNGIFLSHKCSSYTK